MYWGFTEDTINSSDKDLKYDKNMSTIINCIRLSKEVDPENPMSQMKLTAVVPADLCVSSLETNRKGI